MELYSYQKKIVDEVLDNFKRTNRQMIVVPTGGGKTVIFSYVIKQLGLKTLIIGHTRELISQCRNTIQKMHVDNCDIFTIQKTFLNLDKLDKYELIIIDECHRAGASTYLKLIDRFKEAKLIGVTATPFRHDGQKLQDIFGRKISPLTLLDMIEQGLLCDFEGYRVKTNISLQGIRVQKGDFSANSLSSVINVKNRNELIVKEFLKICPQEKSLCFAVDIKHCDELAAEFQKQGVRAKSIHGNISKSKRRTLIDSFKSGDIQVLVNCHILTEGFDEPSITCLLMARPTCSKVLYTQMIGRGSRLFPGKSHCKVIEFTDNEYDVCCIEDLIDSPVKRYKIRDGESLCEYHKRVKKELEHQGLEVHSERMVIIPKSIYEKPATPWQRGFLKTMKISHSEPLTEFKANQLISQVTNGIR